MGWGVEISSSHFGNTNQDPYTGATSGSPGGSAWVQGPIAAHSVWLDEGSGLRALQTGNCLREERGFALSCPSFILPIQFGAVVSPGGRTGRCLLWRRNWYSTPTAWLPMEGFGLGDKSSISQAFPEKSHQGTSSDNRKPGPSPFPVLASWTGKIRTGHMEEAVAPRRMGRLATNMAKPQLLPSLLGAICVTLHPGREGETGRSDPDLGPHVQIAFYYGEAAGFPGRWESEPR